MDKKLTQNNPHTVAVMPADTQLLGNNNTVLLLLSLITPVTTYLLSIGLAVSILSLVLLINVGIISGLILILINR